jgi:hypothetical protein
MMALDASETATRDAALIAYKPNVRLVYIIEDAMVDVQK